MKRRFVVIVRNANAVQQNAVTRYFQSKGYGFWHWAAETWLITMTVAEDVQTLREAVRAIVPGLHVVVLFVTPGAEPNWATFGPQTWIDWFRINWD